jgi:hypothetical protein
VTQEEAMTALRKLVADPDARPRRRARTVTLGELAGQALPYLHQMLRQLDLIRAAQVRQADALELIAETLNERRPP